ncbi:MAG TPA: S53 family peptidase [Solirubrobacteraceae bacterium]|nr:S53 family peptidase [Solirubrobacteraceae bacterium]
MAQRVEIPGSARETDSRHHRVGDVDPDKPIEVTVYLRPSGSLDWVDREAGRAPAERRTMSREELASATGASDADVAAVRSFAGEYGLEVTGVDQGRRAMTLRGTVKAVADAFGAQELQLFEHPTAGQYRGRQGPLTVPGELGGVITGVFGIDDRPQARLHLRMLQQAASTSYTPPQVAAAYNFPTGVSASSQTAGILELGGGFSQADLDTYFKGLGVTAPTVTAVSVDGGTNSPGTDPNADGEVMLDIEVLGAVAPGANIVVYFAPNTDQGFIDALSTAVHDATNKPSAISISWGEAEDAWTAQARTQMEQILTEGAAAGVTVTVASGDNGSTDGVNDGQQHVDFPASAPHALGCGGTRLNVANGRISSETVWNDLPSDGAGGGGISVEFAVPSYQSAITLPDNVDTGKPGRGVPDVAGNADPDTGYSILVDGAQQTVGGTSAVAPLWAGLILLLNASLGKPVGFLQPQIYVASAAGGFHDITQGDNPAYTAGPGWDACSGNGSPNGDGLLAALGGT